MAIALQIAESVAETAVHGVFREFSEGAVSGLETVLQQVCEVAQDRRLERDICLRVCDAQESRDLNQAYRGREEPTNILSFSAGDAGDAGDAAAVDVPLGDLALCWPVAIGEAERQQKTIAHHVVHLCVHGLLHLLDYDHVEDAAAETMESIEARILANLGVPDPYK